MAGFEVSTEALSSKWVKDSDPLIELAIGTRMSQELAEIDAALDRLATSPETLGQDNETGESIPFERLALIPCARVGAERKTEAKAEAESR
jgi:RNA polymerase-binding transcription factor DksA